MKKKLKDNKIFIIILVCFVVLLIVGFNLIFNYTSDSKAIYGNRLSGINKVKITTDEKTGIKDNVESSEKTKSVDVNVQGKIINVLITLKDDTSRDDAKALGSKVLEKLTDKEKEFYDVQLFVKKTTDEEAFPIIGYRHHNKQDFTWTLDR